MHQAEKTHIDVPLPERLQRAPFDWHHANLGPLRDTLLDAQRKGYFYPQPGIPL